MTERYLRRLRAFSPIVYPWPIRERALCFEFKKLQQAAGVEAKCGIFRGAFATTNADRVSGEALQHLKRHKAYSTTQCYIGDVEQRGRKAVEDLYVPNVVQSKPASSLQMRLEGFWSVSRSIE